MPLESLDTAGCKGDWDKPQSSGSEAMRRIRRSFLEHTPIPYCMLADRLIWLCQDDICKQDPDPPTANRMRRSAREWAGVASLRCWPGDVGAFSISPNYHPAQKFHSFLPPLLVANHHFIIAFPLRCQSR